MVTGPSVSAVGTVGLTVAGGYFFGPVGAAAGAVLGSFLFGASGPDIEGPRLGDTSVAASTYGNVIPIAFGVQKLAGAMIWATDIIEDKNTRTEGDGIFGGGQKITEYRYYANFAVAFAEGPCTGLLRLWAGEKLLADLQAPDLIRGGLELLAVAYNFDGVESDGQLKFKKRGSSSIRVITQDELAYVSDPDSQAPELFLETRAQDVDLPARFTVRYNDIERDSDVGVQTVSRYCYLPLYVFCGRHLLGCAIRRWDHRALGVPTVPHGGLDKVVPAWACLEDVLMAKLAALAAVLLLCSPPALAWAASATRQSASWHSLSWTTPPASA